MSFRLQPQLNMLQRLDSLFLDRLGQEYEKRCALLIGCRTDTCS